MRQKNENSKPTVHEISKAITKDLQDAAAYCGRRTSETWSDWLFLTEVTLRMLPAHAESVRNHGCLATDPPEIAEEWGRIEARYGEGVEHLHNAFHGLLKFVQPTNDPPVIRDVLGPLHMEIGNPSIESGQFFTPWDLCITMAEITMKDWPEMVCQRMEAAVKKMPVLSQMLPQREGWITLENARVVADQFFPMMLSKFEPIKIYDPACGSGGTLLAAAAQFPRWMVNMGLVQFYGQDIARDCFLMMRINEMLFGLNGWGLRYQMAAYNLMQAANPQQQSEPITKTEPTATTIPEPIITTTPDKVDVVYPEVKPGQQGSLFEPETRYSAKQEANLLHTKGQLLETQP